MAPHNGCGNLYGQYCGVTNRFASATQRAGMIMCLPICRPQTMKMGLHPNTHTHTLHEAQYEFQQVSLLRALSVGMVHCTDGWWVGAQAISRPCIN
jgi:hypothetical protein